MRRYETERYLAYLGEDPRLREAAPRRLRTPRTMLMVAVVALLAMVLALSYASSLHFASNGTMAAGQDKVVPTRDEASAFIQDIRSRIDGGAECERFFCLVTQLLRAFEAGLLAN